MKIINQIGRLIGFPELGLSNAQRKDILAQSPFVIEQYADQGMEDIVIYFILDTRLEITNKSTLPPPNCVAEISQPLGDKGKRRAENWIIRRILVAGTK